MGDIVRPGAVPMRVAAEVIGTAPIERVDVLHGTRVAQTVRPYRAADLGRRVRVLWQGAEYRGRGRETMWQGKLTLTGNRFARFAPVNFLNPERKVQETAAGTTLTWSSVTTGNLAGIDIWLDEGRRGTLAHRDQRRLGRSRSWRRSPMILSRSRVAALAAASASIACPRRTGAGALAARPHGDFPGRRRPSGLSAGDASDGHQAWTSPIYLIE